MMNTKKAMLCAATFATAVTYGASAWACGGFFCDNAQPINQNAERIIFADNADDTVTAVVQIQYTGPSERFAWVLPVPSVPEVGVSSNVIFTRLQNATNPRYRFNTEVEGDCRVLEEVDSGSGGFSNNAPNSSNNFNAPNTTNNGGVEVLASGSVGPYDYDVIEVTGTPATPEQVALDWLEDNDYDISALGPQLLREYIDAGMKFVAFRLSKDRDAGEIRPVMLTYDSRVPMIPIKLTAIAAEPDMGVLVWVLGQHRSIPDNYKDLVLNEALIDWFNPSTANYNSVVIAAANEAGGQGFVTEYSQPTSQLGVLDNESRDWEIIQNGTFQPNEIPGWYEQIWDLAGPLDGLAEATTAIFMEHLTAEQIDDVVNGDLRPLQALNLTDFDFDAAENLFDDLVFEPIEETDGLLRSLPQMTRMYTTLSADEMTLDPVFEFNAKRPNYDNVHVGTQIIECNPSVYEWQASFRFELPNGGVVRGSDQGVWPFTLANPTMPINAVVLQQNTESETGEVVQDNASAIADALKAHNENTPVNVNLDVRDRFGNPVVDPNGNPISTPTAAGGGCSTTPVAPSLWIPALLGFIVAFRRRD